MNDLAVRPQNSVFKADSLSNAWDISQGLAKSDLIPAAFKLKPHNVMIALMLATDLGINPFTIMQNMSVISGKPCFSTAFLIAQANRHGVFSTPIDWTIEGKGKDLVVTAYAVLARNGMRVSYPVSMAMAAAEGWTKNAKYSTMPELMLRYRSAATLINLYCPEIKSGIPSEEEADALPTVSEGTDIAPAAQTPLGVPQKRGPGRPPKTQQPLPAASAPAPAPSGFMDAETVSSPLTGDEPMETDRLERIDQVERELAEYGRQIYEWNASNAPDKLMRIQEIKNQQAGLVTELGALKNESN